MGIGGRPLCAKRDVPLKAQFIHGLQPEIYVPYLSMNTKSENPSEDDEDIYNDGYGNWEEPKRNQGVKLAILVVLLIILGGFVGAWAWQKFQPVDHRARALEFLALDDYASAIVSLKNVVAENPRDAEMRWLLGKSYLNLDRPTYAADYMQEAFDLGFYDPELLLALARSKLLIREYEDALKLYREWADVKSAESAAAWEVVRGRSLLNLGRQEKAVEAFLQALKYNPDSTEAKWGLAQAGIGSDLSGLTGSEVELALSTGLDQPETWILRGEVALSQGDLKDSRAAFEKAVELGPSNVYALAGLVRILVATNRLDDARDAITTLGREFSNDPMSAYVRALYAKQRHEYELALDALDIVLEHEPNHAMSILLLGEVQYAMGNLELAQDSLSQFHRMVPGSVLGRKRLAMVFIETGSPENAVELLEPMVDQVHRDPEIATTLATAYARMGDQRRAKAYQSLSFKLNAEGAGTQLALQHLSSGNVQRAISELEQTVNETPEEIEGRIVLAVSHLEKGDMDAAIAVSEPLLAERPSDPQVVYLHATVLELSGKTLTAESFYERTLEIDPQHSAADLALARIEMDTDRREQARGRIESLLERDRDNATAYVWLAQMAMQDGNMSEAVKRLETARARNIDALQPRIILADIYLQRRAAEEALAVTTEILKMVPNHPVGNYLYANAQVMAGNLVEGLMIMEHLEESSHPDNLKLKWRMVEAQEQLGDQQATYATLTRILDVEENNPRALVKLAMLERKRGDDKAAVVLADRLTENYPSSGMGFLIKGQLMMDDGNYLVASDFLERAYALNNDSVSVSRYYMALYGADEKEKAEEIMSQWLDKNPTDSVSRLAIAEQAKKGGDLKRAIEEYEWVSRREPENVAVLVLLAKAYHDAGDRRDLKTAQIAFQLAVDDIYAKHYYAWLLVDTGLSERGAELLKEVVAAAPNNGTFRFHLVQALVESDRKDEAGRILKELMRSKIKFDERNKAEELMESLGLEIEIVEEEG
ncbi:MAG: putative PEP-CTERM system TPR-repeat lipoprotein [Halioglobus sp.]|jgi:putative PEP-CTERM system TPR-repeat lipoprotein